GVRMNLTTMLFSEKTPPPPSGGRGGGPKRPGQIPGRQFRAFTFWLLFALLAVVLVHGIMNRPANEHEISYTEFMNQVKAKNVVDLLIIERDVQGTFKEEVLVDGGGQRSTPVKQFKVTLPADDPDLAEKVWAENPEAEIRSRPTSTPWFNIFFSWWIPLLAIFLLWIFFIRQMQAGGSAALKFGKSKARVLNENAVK